MEVVLVTIGNRQTHADGIIMIEEDSTYAMKRDKEPVSTLVTPRAIKWKEWTSMHCSASCTLLKRKNISAYGEVESSEYTLQGPFMKFNLSKLNEEA